MFPSFHLPSSSLFSSPLRPLPFLRSSSASTTLMADHPTTPTAVPDESHHFSYHTYISPSATSTSHSVPSFFPPPPLPSASPSAPSSSPPPSLSSSASSSSSVPPVASPTPTPVPLPTRRTRLRSLLTRLVLPCFSHKSTRLLLSLILVTLTLIQLYFSAFAFYLTHLLSPSTSASSCATFPLSIFLVFCFFRALCDLLLISIRMRDPLMWVNQWPQLSSHQRVYQLLNAALTAFSALFLCFGFVWVASAESKSCAPMGLPLVVGVVTWEAVALCFPLLVVAALTALYPLKSLSLFAPWVPLTSETFTVGADALGLSHKEVQSLPSFVYGGVGRALWADDDRRCSICLCDVEVGEAVRELQCHHHFHQPCIDEWLGKRASCPLCVGKVEGVKGGRARRWRLSLSRTRRDSATTSSSQQDRDMSVTVSDRESGEGVGLEALEMV